MFLQDLGSFRGQKRSAVQGLSRTRAFQVAEKLLKRLRRSFKLDVPL